MIKCNKNDESRTILFVPFDKCVNHISFTKTNEIKLILYQLLEQLCSEEKGGGGVMMPMLRKKFDDDRQCVHTN